MNYIDTISIGKIVQIREQLMNQQAEGKTIYRFESGDPSFRISIETGSAMANAIHENKTHYISNEGIPALRFELANKLRSKNNINCAKHNVFITNGAMHALYITFQCLLEKDDEVIVPCPLWTEIGENIKLSGGVLSSVTLHKENNYNYDYSDIAKKINNKTKAIFINTPHNPTGAVISKNDLIKIANLAEYKGLWLICDEAYEDIIYEGKHFSPASIYDKTISIYSFSKSHAMSGLRVGYIVAKDKQFKERVQKLLRCTINGVNSIAQWGALAAITGNSHHLKYMMTEYRNRRKLMFDGLSGLAGIDPFKPQGAFYLWCEIEKGFLKLRNKNINQFCEFLVENGIGCVPNESFGSTIPALRFSFSCETNMIQDGILKLRELINDI